ncbi:MAG: hypothetical protein GYB31_11605 [Bacteroidetes bacterium]|nr:hypothetical protein [Bacteroidota bacterium]
MAEKQIDPGKMNLGDLGVIRKILMGEQMNEYDNRFSDVDQKHQELSANIEQSEQSLQTRIDVLEQSLDNRLDKIEALLTEQVEMLKDQISAQSREDRHLIGNLLQKVGQQLLKD